MQGNRYSMSVNILLGSLDNRRRSNLDNWLDYQEKLHNTTPHIEHLGD